MEKQTMATRQAPSAQGEMQSSAQVVGAVIFYMATALVMVMTNKAALSSVPDLPLLFLWSQLAVAVVLMHVTAQFGMLKLPRLDKDIAHRLMPLIGINVVGLAMNTLCLKHVDASVFQVSRGLVVPFTVVLSTLYLRQECSHPVKFACLVICMGFFCGMLDTLETATAIPLAAKQTAGSASVQNNTSAMLGIIYGIASSLTTAAHAIIIKRTQSVISNTFDLTYYNNLLSAVGLFPLLIFNGELSWMHKHYVVGNDQHGFVMFLRGVFVTGIFGFLINMASFLQIKMTSPITHMISSAVRGVLQTILAVMLFGDVINAWRVLAIVLILYGSCLYTWIRHHELSRTTISCAVIHDKQTKPV